MSSLLRNFVPFVYSHPGKRSYRQNFSFEFDIYLLHMQNTKSGLKTTILAPGVGVCTPSCAETLLDKPGRQRLEITYVLENAVLVRAIN
jgi:hypothetical protein